MPIITGGNIIPPGPPNPGTKQPIYATQGLPTDATIGIPVANIINGMLATDVLTGHLYERRAGVWTRMDTV